MVENISFFPNISLGTHFSENIHDIKNNPHKIPQISSSIIYFDIEHYLGVRVQ